MGLRRRAVLGRGRRDGKEHGRTGRQQGDGVLGHIVLPRTHSEMPNDA